MDGRFCPITSSVILKMFKLPRASSMKRLCHVCQKKEEGEVLAIMAQKLIKFGPLRENKEWHIHVQLVETKRNKR